MPDSDAYPNIFAKCSERLQELGALEDGWHDEYPESKAPTDQSMTSARAFVEALADRPRIFPTLDGGLMFEWSIPGYEIGVEIDPWGGTDQVQIVKVSNA